MTQLPGETVVRMYEKMVGLCQVDQQLYKAQRMVRISHRTVGGDDCINCRG